MSDVASTQVETRRAIEAVFRIESPKVIAVSRDRARRGRGRRAGAGRAGGRARAVAEGRHAGQSRRVAHGDRDSGRSMLRRRNLIARKHDELEQAIAPTAASWATTRGDAARSTTTSVTIVDVDLHGLSSRALARGARRAHAAAARGPHDAGDRARLPGAEPTIAQRIVRAKRTLAEAQVPFEVPRGAELARAARRGARGHLPGVQRGLLGDRRRRLDAPGAVRGRAAPRAACWPSSRPASPRCTGWWR